MTNADNLIGEAAGRIFADLCDPQAVNRATGVAWKEALWGALSDSGLTQCWVPESLGGPGATLGDGFSVLRIAGAFAVPLPLAETMLAGWLLAQGGLALPSGMVSLAPTHPTDEIMLAEGKLSGCAHAVPFASHSEHLAVLAKSGGGYAIVLVDRRDCACVTAQSLANDPLDLVDFDGVRPLASAPAPSWLDPQTVLLMGSVARSMQIAGALEYMLSRSVAYAQERVAFEKKISKFQAVQQNLARLAGEAAAAIAAAGSAADALSSGLDWSSPGLLLEAAAAKIRSAEAARTGAAIAHQVHGAIGITAEYVLHRFTLRALSWRDDFGNESHWAVVLGRSLAAQGPEQLWPLVASR